MSRAPGKYVAGTMAPAGAALDRPGLSYILKAKDAINHAKGKLKTVTKVVIKCE
jgi:hypothetical protein